MYWRYTQQAYASSSRQCNQAALQALVEAGIVPGLLAYQEHRPVGWCGLGPRAHFARLLRSRHFRPVDVKSTWSIACFFVSRQHRRQHTATALLGAAVAYARSHGAQAVEGYPIKTWSEEESMQAAFPEPWRGLRRLGFTRSLGPRPAAVDNAGRSCGASSDLRRLAGPPAAVSLS
jgi:GNAT superfamily N-acetyltransferase